MGFRNGSFASVWDVQPINDRVTKCRISISRKRKDTDTYEQDFGGYVSFLGTAAAGKAAKLKERDRIKLLQVDVQTNYDKIRQKEYINYICYEFEMADNPPPVAAPPIPDSAFLDVEEGNIDEEFLPY